MRTMSRCDLYDRLCVPFYSSEDSESGGMKLGPPMTYTKFKINELVNNMNTNSVLS